MRITSGTLLPAQDAYALSRALLGLPRSAVPVSPIVQALLTRIDLQTPEGMKLLKHLLAPELLKQILAIDPMGKPPGADTAGKSPAVLDPVPELPAEATLTPEQEQEATTVGQWLRDYVTWAGSSANETPKIFHQGAGRDLAHGVIGRGLHLDTPCRR